MAPTPHELLQLAIDTLPANERSSPAPALARKLGMPYQKVYKWVESGTAPGAVSCLAILERLGWLNMSADAREGAASPPADPLVEIASRVAELARGQARIAAELGIQLGTDEQAEAPETPREARPKRKSA